MTEIGKRKRWRRVLVWCAGCAVVAAAGLVALAPTLLSGPIGCGLVADAIAPMVNGTVEVRGLSLSWGGPQSIEAVAIRGEGGDEVAVGASVDAGLIALVRQSEPLRVSLSGSVSTRYDERGKPTIAGLLRTREPGTDAAAPAPAHAAGDSAGSANPIPDGSVLELSKLRVLARPIAAGTEVELSSLAGTVKLAGAEVVVELASPTRVGADTGSLSVRGRAGGVLTQPFTLDGCSLALEVNGTALAIPAEGAPLRVDELALKVISVKLGERADGTLRAAITLPDGSKATIASEVEASAPLDLARLSVRARVTVDDLPSAALVPYLPAQVVAARDIGPSVKATIVVDGRAADIAVATDRLSLRAHGTLLESGDAVALDSLACDARVDPMALPEGARPAVPVQLSLTGSVARWPIAASAVGAGFATAECDLVLAIQPNTITVVGSKSLSLDATTVSIASHALGESARVRVAGRVNGAGVSCDESIDGLGRVAAEGVKALHAKGRVTIEPVRLDSLPWLPDATVAALAGSAVDAVSLDITNDGGSTGGSAAITLGLGGASTLATTASFTQTGFTTDAIHIEHDIAPATVAALTRNEIAASEAVHAKVDIDPLSGTWKGLDSGVPITGQVRVKLAVPRLALAHAPGIQGALLIEDLVAAVGLGFVDDVAPQTLSVEAQWRAEAALKALSGAGQLRASVDRTETHDAFTLDLAMPSISIATSGRLSPSEPGGPVAVDLGATRGEFSIPVGEPAAPVAGSFAFTRLGWRGRPQGSSCEGTLALKPGSVGMPGRPKLAWGAIEITLAAADMTGDVSLSLNGSVGVGADPTPIQVVTHAHGRLDEVQLTNTTGHIEADLEQVRALAAWWQGNPAPGAPAVRLSPVKADFTVRSFELPRAGHAGAADATIDLGVVRIEPGGRRAFDFGPARLTVKSASFEHDLALGIDAPDSLQLDALLKGDLRGFFDAGATPLALSASTVRLRVPGALALASVDWWRQGSAKESTVESLGAVDATVTIDSLRTAATGLADAAVKASVAVAPIQFSLKGKPPIELGASGVTVESVALGRELDCTLATGGVKAGSIQVRAHGTGQKDAAGAFAPLSGSWNASARVARLRTELVDALLGQGGSLSEALGETIDLDVTAVPAAATDGTAGTGVHASIKTPSLTIDVPAARIGGGFITLAPDAPLTATFVVNDALRKRLLEPINPVLSDIRSAPPVKATISRCAYPTDGNLARFDLDARIEFGDVEVVRSNQVIGVLALAQESKGATIPARIEPLVLAVQAGILRYRDFVLKMGKFGEDWKQILKLSGEIDLTKSPPFARAISCRYPLASLGRTIGGASGPFTSTMQELSDQLQKLPIDPGMLFDVDVTLSGPLGEVNGQSRPLDSKVRLAIDPSAIDAKKVKEGIKDIGQTIDGFRKLFGK